MVANVNDVPKDMVNSYHCNTTVSRLGLNMSNLLISTGHGDNVLLAEGDATGISPQRQ